MTMAIEPPKPTREEETQLPPPPEIFTEEDVRSMMMERGPLIENYDKPIRGLERLTGHLAVKELTGRKTLTADRLSKNEEGESDEALQMAGIVAQGLILRRTGKRIFNNADIGWMAENMGLSILAPIASALTELSGLGKDALARAKKNSTKIVNSDLASSSRES